MALRTPRTAMGVGTAAERRMPARARNMPKRTSTPTLTMMRASAKK
ncbi:MAG: hypothetical protein ACK4VI_06930 [Alphaproteobacteria bacterium]